MTCNHQHQDELLQLLKIYGYIPGRYVLKNGLAFRVWYEGEELKFEEDPDVNPND